MARSLSQALIAAVNSTGAQPAISAVASDPISRFSLFTTRHGDSPARNAAILSSSGSIIRAAVTNGNDPNSIYIYRIPAPITTSGWQATAVDNPSSNVMKSAGCCLVQTGSTIRCLWIDATDAKPRYVDSASDGQVGTWGSVQTGFPADPLPNNLCYGITADSTTSVYVAYASYSYAACVLYHSTYSGSWGAWASVGPPTPTWGGLRGIMFDAAKSPEVLVAGVQTRAQQSGYAAAAATLTGTTWSGFTTIVPMDTPTNGLSYLYPSVHYDGSQYYYAVVTLTDDGSVSGSPGQRSALYRSTDGLNYTLVCAFGNSVFGSTEAHCINVSGTLYVFDQVNVYSAAAPPSTVDLSADVLALEVTETSLEHRTLSLKVANQSGQYSGIAVLRDNASISLSLGYVPPGGSAQTVLCFLLYIDAVRLAAGGDSLELVLDGRGVTKYLDQISPIPQPFMSMTVATIATRLCALANVPLGALPATAQFSQVVPCFILSAGETYLNGMKRLADVYGFDLLESPPGTVKIVERNASDPSSWSYGTETLAIAAQSNADGPNIIRVVGQNTTNTNIFAEVTDPANLLTSGVHRFELIVDRMLDTAAKCLIRAGLELHDVQTKRSTGSALVTLNPQLELMDVITVTDPRVGLASQNYRIETIHTHIDFQTGQFDQTLELAAP